MENIVAISSTFFLQDWYVHISKIMMPALKIKIIFICNILIYISFILTSTKFVLCIVEFCEFLADLPEPLGILVAGGLDGGLLLPDVAVVLPALPGQAFLKTAV